MEIVASLNLASVHTASRCGKHRKSSQTRNDGWWRCRQSLIEKAKPFLIDDLWLKRPCELHGNRKRWCKESIVVRLPTDPPMCCQHVWSLHQWMWLSTCLGSYLMIKLVDLLNFALGIEIEVFEVQHSFSSSFPMLQEEIDLRQQGSTDWNVRTSHKPQISHVLRVPPLLDGWT